MGRLGRWRAGVEYGDCDRIEANESVAVVQER